MNKYDFTALVKNPNSIGESETEKLRDLVQTYPYFSVARNLLVKSLYKSSHYEYDSALKQAALQTGNRTVLYNLVHDLPLNTDSLVFAEQGVEAFEISTSIDSDESSPVGLTQVLEETEIEVLKIESAPIKETQEPIKAEVDRFVMPEDEEVAPVISKPRSTEITEEEQLIKPTGKFVKFIPKKPAKQIAVPPSKSSIHTKQDEEVLNEFDISSLNTLGNWQPAKPLYVETPEPIEDIIIPAKVEEEVLSYKVEIEIIQIETIAVEEIVIDQIPAATIEPVVIPEIIHFTAPNIAPEVIVPSSVITDYDGKTEATDNDFLNWLSKKESVKIKEDVNFVDNFIQAISAQSNKSLVDEINLHLPKIEDQNESEIIVPVLEDKVTPAFEFNFDFAKNDLAVEVKKEDLETIKAEVVETDLLASLASYEIDIFLAQVYRSVKFDGQMFEQQFFNYFPEVEKPIYIPAEVVLPKTPSTLDSSKVELELPAKPKELETPEIHIPKFVQFEIEELPKASQIIEVAPIKEGIPEFKPKREVKTSESILDKFIRENPTIARPKSEFYNPVNMAKQSVESDDELVSETLATIYLRQGLHKKAIYMYEKLGLLYPDKLAYFAGLIEKIKNENNLN